MFAGTDSSYEDSQFVIVGVPFDKTSSFRAGTADGPRSVREASYCFEPYMVEHDISLYEVPIHDKGDIKEYEDISDIKDELKNIVYEIISDGKIPIIIGGEHSLTPFVVKGFEKHFDSIDVVVLDAHLDFREEYEGLKNSHATAVKRTSESSVVRDIKVLGVRSVSIKEAGKEKPPYVEADELYRRVDSIKGDDVPVYLSIDMDVFDPSYAPGVGNPEPFGVEPRTVKQIIQNLSSNLIGIDIVETNPRFDPSEITSNLAARLIYEFIGSKESKK